MNFFARNGEKKAMCAVRTKNNKRVEKFDKVVIFECLLFHFIKPFLKS